MLLTQCCIRNENCQPIALGNLRFPNVVQFTAFVQLFNNPLLVGMNWNLLITKCFDFLVFKWKAKLKRWFWQKTMIIKWLTRVYMFFFLWQTVFCFMCFAVVLSFSHWFHVDRQYFIVRVNQILVQLTGRFILKFDLAEN